MAGPIKIACFGDSLTRGNFSYNWVKKCKRIYRSRAVEFLNFGVNGELAYNGLKRIDQVIASDPDMVIVLFGSNDVMGALNEESTAFYQDRQHLPQRPSLEFFRESMSGILDQLRAKTSAQIICLSIPPLGEVLNDATNQLVAIYNSVVSEYCRLGDLLWLDLNKVMVDYLARNQLIDPYPYQSDRNLVLKSAAKKYLLLKKWDQVSKMNHLVLTSDGIHLNESSGQLLIELLKPSLDGLMNQSS